MGERDMFMPIASLYGNTSIIVIVVIVFVVLYYLYKLGRNARSIEAGWKEKAQKSSKLQRGDSQAKISTAIGKPDSIEECGEGSKMETWIYDCGKEGKRVITFKDGFTEKIEVKY